MAQAIADRQFKRGNTSEEYLLIIAFGYVVLIDTITALLTVTVAGAVFDCIGPAVVYGIVFIPLRIHAGGFHFGNAFVCLIFSTIVDVAAVFLIANAQMVPVIIQAVLFIAAAVIIGLLAPIETPGKPLDAVERKVYGRRTKIIVSAYFFVSIALYIIGALAYLIAIGVAAVYVASLIVAGFVANKRRLTKLN